MDDDQIFIQSRKINPTHLPIRMYKSQILYGLDMNSSLVILAETGSGKTTQIPQYLIEAGYGKVVVSVPRRMAAISIAQRVSDENGSDLGDQIGYRVRFESRVCENTKVEYVTDGTLIQMLMSNPLMEGYYVVMLDDIHERTVNSDLLLSLMKKILVKRPELKLIVSSATLQAQVIKQFLHEVGCGVVYVKGRNYDVDIYYLHQECKNYVVKAVEVVKELRNEGDVLVFMTSVDEINAFIELMGDQSKKMQLLRLHANMALEKQLEVFKGSNLRKVIVSTNIAESSITIDGIVYVIDCCYQKVKVYDYKRNVDCLRVVPISQQQAQQRAGRAGRTRNGYCYRLCTQSYYQSQLPLTFPPEILRTKLTDLILQLRSFSIMPNTLASNQHFLTPIPIQQLSHSLNILLATQLLNSDLTLTPLGEAVVDYPLNQQLAIALENSFNEQFQCSEEMLKIASILSIQGGIFQGDAPPLALLKAKKALGCKEGDILSLHNIFVRYIKLGNAKGWCETYRLSRHKLEQAAKVYKQLQKKRNSRPLKSSVDDVESVIRCLLTAYFMNVAQRNDSGNYKNIFNNQIMYLQPSSVLNVSPPHWLFYYDLVEQSSRLVMRETTEIDPHWLLEIAPQFYTDARKDQAQQKHLIEQEKLNQWEEEKQKLLESKQMETESKVVFGSFKNKTRNIASQQSGFIKPNIPIKSKQDRVGSLKKSQLLSFNDDDL